MNQANISAPAARQGTSAGAPAWLWLSVGAALLAIAGNIIALGSGGIYARLTASFLPQALSQDIADLAVVAPAWLVLATLALRGSPRAYLAWLGVVGFTVYNYVIYTVAVPFGPLFPLWVAVLGLCLYALIGGLSAVDHRAMAASFQRRRRVQVTAWALLITATLFAFLWLSEDVPALLVGGAPQSLADNGMLTNPVHILDCAFFLPALLATGILLLKRRPLAYTLAPGFVVFVVLTGIPILLTPVVQTVRGLPAGWGVVVPIGTLTLVHLGLLAWLLSSVKSR